jgi:hypothetical protein
MSDAVLIFYGVSTLLAAERGHAGCESPAISNWLLRRDDQLGCLFFSPIDLAERKAFHQPNGIKHMAASPRKELENEVN